MPGADPSAAEHDLHSSGRRSTVISGAAGTGDAAGGQRLPATSVMRCSMFLPGLGAGGDAAHTIHPLAGQGLTLAIVMSMPCGRSGSGSARSRSEVWASPAVAEALPGAAARADKSSSDEGWNCLCRSAMTWRTPVRMLRNSLMAAERAGVLKRQALKYALGL